MWNAVRSGVSWFACGSIGVVRKKTNRKKRIGNKMFRVRCLVIDIKDNFYDVFIDSEDGSGFYQINAVDAEKALRKAFEYEYGDGDLIIHLRDKCGFYCIYDVDDGADDGDECLDDFGFVFGA